MWFIVKFCTTWYGLLTEAFGTSVELEREGFVAEVIVLAVELLPVEACPAPPSSLFAFSWRFCSSIRRLNISRKLPSFAKVFPPSSSDSGELSLSLFSFLELIFWCEFGFVFVVRNFESALPLHSNNWSHSTRLHSKYAYKGILKQHVGIRLRLDKKSWHKTANTQSFVFISCDSSSE